MVWFLPLSVLIIVMIAYFSMAPAHHQTLDISLFFYHLDLCGQVHIAAILTRIAFKQHIQFIQI